MKEIGKFLVDNWQWVITAVLSVFVFIVQIFRKRPVVRSLGEYLNSITATTLPILINKAEVSGLHGEAKKQYVIDEALKVLKFVIKLDDQAEEFAIDYFGKEIEKILSTPRKKD